MFKFNPDLQISLRAMTCSLSRGSVMVKNNVVWVNRVSLMICYMHHDPRNAIIRGSILINL